MKARPEASARRASTPPASLGSAFKAIGWGFLGIRKRDGQQQDAARVRPLQLIAVGLIAVILFVLGLIALVHWIVPQ